MMCQDFPKDRKWLKITHHSAEKHNYRNLMTIKSMYNRLKDENSAYLKQHADNPVFWWPYGPEAIQKSKDENKPIFLSVGYSSCHWCHVMAEESFADQETADIMNQNFICVKVDREEFPDIDQYYQQACQLFTQSGGWPLSAFLLPDMRPFFVGTYFPKLGTQEHASFKDILNELHRAFTEDKGQVEENASKSTEALLKGMMPEEKVEFEGHFPPPMAILDAIKEFEDVENGGYGAAPKFPQFSFYLWAVEQMLEGMVTKEKGEHIILTLEKMLMGGVIDHARGGIHRYATKANWNDPHYEKMLYDQAGLLSLLAKLSLIYPSPLVYDHLISTLEYLEAEMLGDDKYFFSGQDADSEGVEGLYFNFTEEEFEGIANQAISENQSDKEKEPIFTLDQVKTWFNITGPGLHSISLNFDTKDELFTLESWDLVREIKKKILNQRKQRIPPFTDNKGVASWNFQLISSLVDVMQYCKIDVIRQHASRLFNQSLDGLYNHFLLKTADNKMGLKHSTTKESSLPYLEDFVFFAETQLRVYEITGNPIFKNNFRDTLDFIYQEFVSDDKVKTRAKSSEDFELYPNIDASPFDASFKSPVATLILLTRRASLLFLDREWIDRLEKLKEKVTNDVLKNPIASGEALRALTYPDDSYRIVKLPQTWLNDAKFLGFIPYFLTRFVLDYHKEDNEEWQICNLTSCELQGVGVDSFMATLAPQNESEEKKENKDD
jgi:uncharacterized protein